MVYTTIMQPGGKYYGAAAQYNSSGPRLGNLFKIIGLVVGVLVLISLGFLGYTVLTSTNKNTAAQLVARQRQLTTFVAAHQTDISNDTLQTINSNANSLLTSDGYALLQGLKTFGLTAVPEDIAKNEADTTSTKTLDNAKIQNNFDRIYLELLREKVAATESLARTVRSNSNGTMKTATDTLLTNLSVIDEQLAKLQL